MSDFPIPDAALKRHTAILGMTGSGKSSTGRVMVEHVVAQGHRVCILDTLKSDWWGITSSANGQKAGLPFTILGGPRGHMELPSSAGKAIGQLVGNGKLPLSIIDMADFEPGGLQRFFVDFAQSLLKNIKGVVYLVIEEAHEVAPKERAGFGAENMAIHYAKKLGTGSRTKGIRLIVATQRVQALHNAVLGSCETVIAHRIGFADDQVPVLKWMKAKIGAENTKTVEAELANLPDGEAFIASGAPVKIFERRKFPLFKTFDNTKTPDGDLDDLKVTTAFVDRAELKTIIGDTIRQEESDNPEKLRTRIKILESDNQKLERERDAAKLNSADPAAAIEAEKRGWQQGYEAGEHNGFKTGFEEASRQGANQINDIKTDVSALIDEFSGKVFQAMALRPPTFNLDEKYTRPSVSPAASKQPASAPMQRAAPPARVTSPAASGDASLSGPQLTLLKSLAWWRRMGHDNPTRPQVAAIAGWRVTAGHLRNVVGSLNAKGLTQASAGKLSLTAAGVAAAPDPDMGQTLHDGLRGVLTRPQQTLFDVLWKFKRKMTREALANACGWDPKAGHLRNVIGSMRTLEIIDYPEPGVVALQDWVMG